MIKGKIIPIRDNVLVSDMDFDVRTTKGGIFLLNDDGKSEGIRPRWGRVWAVGDEQQDLKVGDWVLVEHGRWTRGISTRSTVSFKVTFLKDFDAFRCSVLSKL